MRYATCSTQPFTPPEAIVATRRPEGAARHGTPPEVDDVIDCLTAAMFGEVVKSLRSALALN
jgi:hypothetical protein